MLSAACVQSCTAGLCARHSAFEKTAGMCQAQAVPAAAQGTSAALDWLCLNLDPADLPRRFSVAGASTTSASSGVKLVARASARAAANRPQPAMGVPFKASAPPQHQQQRQRSPRSTEQAKGPVRTSWMEHYLEQEASSSEDGGEDKVGGTWRRQTDRLGRIPRGGGAMLPWPQIPVSSC
jgi:hypothetical protein